MRSIYLWIIIAAMWLVFFIMEFVVSPKMLQVYEDLKIQKPFVTRYSLYIGFFVLLSFSVLLLSRSNKDSEYVSETTNEGYLKITPIISKDVTMLEPLLLLALGIMVGFYVLSIVMPIYSLTSNF